MLAGWRFNLPGESSETGVLDGVGLCPGGRKCEGEPLLEPPPAAKVTDVWEKMFINYLILTRF